MFVFLCMCFLVFLLCALLPEIKKIRVFKSTFYLLIYLLTADVGPMGVVVAAYAVGDLYVVGL